MGAEQWLKVLNTVSGLAAAAGQFRRGLENPEADGERGGPMAGPLEARLAGVVVAALQEAFDRDRTRMDLERTQAEAERRRAEEALAAELRRQAAERSLGQLRLIAVMAMGAWIVSAALAAWIPGMRAGVPLAVLGLGWLNAFAALGAAFAGWQHVSAWSANPRASAAEAAPHPALAAAPWLLLIALALSGAALLLALIHT